MTTIKSLKVNLTQEENDMIYRTLDLLESLNFFFDFDDKEGKYVSNDEEEMITSKEVENAIKTLEFFEDRSSFIMEM